MNPEDCTRVQGKGERGKETGRVGDTSLFPSRYLPDSQSPPTGRPDFLDFLREVVTFDTCVGRRATRLRDREPFITA